MYHDLQYYIVPIVFILTYVILYFFTYIKKISYSGSILEEKLNKEDIYIITNDSCKCWDIKVYNIIFCKVKCNLCKIKRVINFEKESDIYYLLEHIKGRVNFLIHTNGGAAEFPNFLTYILKQQNIYVETIIPQHAISAGSFIALSSNIITMNWYSSMGPVDTQLYYSSYHSDDEIDGESFPAKYVKDVTDKSYALTRLRAMEAESYHQDDLFIINSMFKKKKKRELIIKNFLETPHSHSIKYGPLDLRDFGLNVRTGIPIKIKLIFDEFKKLYD